MTIMNMSFILCFLVSQSYSISWDTKWESGYFFSLVFKPVDGPILVAHLPNHVGPLKKLFLGFSFSTSFACVAFVYCLYSFLPGFRNAYIWLDLPEFCCKLAM